MARFQNEGGSKATWWVHINLTAVIGIVALLAVGYIVKREHDKGKEQEAQEAERSRKEREARDRENAILLAERERDQHEAEEAKRKDDKELAKERMALDEQRRRAKQKAEEERLAELQAQKLQTAKARDAGLEEKRKQLQAEQEAAAQKAAELAAQQEAQKKMSAAQLRDEYKSAIKEISDLDDKLKGIEARIIAYRNKSQAAQKQKDAQDRTVQDLTASQGSKTASTVAPRTSPTSYSGTGTSSSSYSTGVTPSGIGTGVPTVKVVVDNSDGIAKGLAKSEAAGKELKDSQEGYDKAVAEKAELTKAIETAKAKRDNAAARLKAMGQEVTEKAAPKPQSQGADVPLASPARKVFVMKDGKKIVALKVVETPDEYSVKKEDGKFETIPKDLIEKIIEE